MQTPRPLENPFDLNKASDYSDSEILDYWVDLADSPPGGLLSILRPRLRMPMLLLGGKGSGKTHLMRYCSAPVQAARQSGDIRRAVSEDGYLGIYVRAEGLNTDKFAKKGYSEDFWAPIFGMYFELWLATNLLTVVRNYVGDSPDGFSEIVFSRRVADLFDVDVEAEFNSLPSLLDYLTKVRKGIDFAVNNASLMGDMNTFRITFSQGKLVFGIPNILRDMVPGLQDTILVYLIDEAENFTASQQRFINSLIRYRSGNATIKVGARLYGIKTYETLGAGEPIKRDSEYERVELDGILRERRTDYERLVSRLVIKRLQRFGVLTSDARDSELSRFFEELDHREFWKAVGAELLHDYPTQRERPHLRKLRGDLKALLRLSEQETEAVVSAISFTDHLYLEKASVFSFYKRWPSTRKEALHLARSTSRQAHALLRNDRERARDLAQIISHFGSDILAQLYRDFHRKVPYAGFRTLIDLSQGIPRNLLTNLKHIYRRSLFAREQPFSEGIVSIRSQTDGVRDGAAWFWEDAQPDSDGMQIREAIEAIAILFRTVRFSDAPAECDLCTFSVDRDGLTENSRRVLRIAENWSYLIRIRDGSKNRNNRRVDAKYQLGPMLVPRWEVSEHRRGSIELKPQLANAIFDPEHRSDLPALFRRRISGMMLPSARPEHGGVGELFDPC